MGKKKEYFWKETSGLLIPAGLFIWMGIGWAMGYLVQGLMVGLGFGFLMMALVKMKFQK